MLAHRAPRAQAAASTDEVDLLLILAADISHSMQPADLRMQREGYVAALRDGDVLGAIRSGPCGAVAMLYLEWSGTEDQRVLVPWTRIAGAEDAQDFAAALAAAPQRVGSWTSISGAIAASRRLMRDAPFAAERRVVDISGDGENNNGEPVQAQRDLAVGEGITINGLPILRGPSRHLASTGADAPPLEAHYRDLVIGGPGAFALPAEGFDAFHMAIRRKLVMEIAWRGGDTATG
ncbi:DUF1194 domain-containing protein [Falsiroseomonas sp. CW058]|uniref:DUF1194 domain-containing protein n=1 Tax=Falsiroseomonas sp. CW058 TaxID=3388664 RepID=UPI003D31CD53